MRVEETQMLRKSAPILLLIAALPLVAQDADPPSRVARLNLLSGSISFRPASVEEWTGATLNYPLTTGDHLWADAGSRAEMHAGSTAIRLSERTAMSVVNLCRPIRRAMRNPLRHPTQRRAAAITGIRIRRPSVRFRRTRPGHRALSAALT